MKIAVIFHSPSGTTKQLAQAIAEGAAQPDIEVIQAEIVGADIEEGRFRNTELLQQLTSADALVFGSPTYMGGVSAQFKAFADATGELWEQQAWANKIAAGFTIGGNISGDQQCTLQYLQVFANQHGMLWAGVDIPGGYDTEQRNRFGAQSGLIAHSADGDLHKTDLITARYLGERIAKLVRRLSK